MNVCPKHNRWIELRSGARRDCPECPKRVYLRRVVGLLHDEFRMLTTSEAGAYDAIVSERLAR